MLYVTQWQSTNDDIWTAFVFDVGPCDGAVVCDDLDGLVTEAAFFSEPDAIERLLDQPFRVMSEPIVSFLRDETGPGALWCYRRGVNGDDALANLVDSPPVGVAGENPFDVLALHAEAEYRAGRTRSLQSFAAEYGVSLDEPGEGAGSRMTGDVAR